MSDKPISDLTESVKRYYDKLFQDGFLVSVHVSKWSMSTSLNKEDVKFSDKDEVPAIFKLGRKMLIEQEVFNQFGRLESRARRYLDSHSFNFHIAEAHFVPKKKIAVVLDTLDKFKQEYLALRDNFVENYEAHKTKVLETYVDLADELRGEYPDAKDIKGKFDFNVSLFELRMPQELGEVDIQSLITRDKAEATVKQEMENRLKDHYKQSLTKIETFTQEAATVLRGQVVSMCKTVKDKIASGEVVSKRNIQMIREEIANFRTLNFFEDKAVEDELDKLGQIVAGNVNYKTDKEALEELNAALGGVMERATNISDLADISGKYFRAIKI